MDRGSLSPPAFYDFVHQRKKPHLPALAGSRARDACAATAFTGGKLGTPNHPVLAKRGDWQDPCQHVEKVLWGNFFFFPAKKSKNSPKTVSKKQGIFWIWISEFGQKGSDLEISLSHHKKKDGTIFVDPSPYTINLLIVFAKKKCFAV